MTSRTIVGAIALLALIGIGIYLLVQIPWEFGVGGILALIGIWLAIGRSAPDAL
jgi:preprotein translocase subunit SecF